MGTLKKIKLNLKNMSTLKNFFFFSDKYCNSGECFSSFLIYIYIYMFVSVFIFNFDMYFGVSYALSKYQCHILLMYFHQALDINSNVSVCLWWLSYSSK